MHTVYIVYTILDVNQIPKILFYSKVFSKTMHHFSHMYVTFTLYSLFSMDSTVYQMTHGFNKNITIICEKMKRDKLFRKTNNEIQTNSLEILN